MADRTLDRVEVWDTLESDGGQRLAVLPDVLSISKHEVVSDADRITLEVGRQDPGWDALQEERAVRVVYESAPWEEYRIREIDRQLTGDGDMKAEVVAEGILQDLLHNARMLERVEANGRTMRHFEIYQVDAADHLSIILEPAPSYISAGTVEPGEPVDMIYHNDSPLSALKELLRVATFADGTVGAEVRLRRNGTSGYLVDIVRQVGSSDPTVEIRDAANLIEGSQRSDSTKIGTVVHPIGGNTYGHEGTMARASWPVVAQSGATLTFADDILVESGQLVGKYALLPDGTHHQISSTSAPRTVTLTADPGVDLVGQRVRFRRQIDVGAYGQLSYMESPASIAKWGIEKAVRLERPDLPAIDNLAPNPLMEQWVSGRPADYELIGLPTVEKNTDPFYWRTGGASAHVTAQEGQGLRTGDVQVFPSAADPFYVTQIQIWVVSGSVRLELFDVTSDEVFPGSEFSNAVTVATGRWIDSFGVAPGGTPQSNFFTRGTEHLQVRVVADRGPAEFYLDTVQLTNSQSFEEVFYGGRASNVLWRAANDALAKVRDPEQAYEIGMVDEYRLGEVDVDTRQINLGADAHVVAENLGIDFTTRIMEVEEDLLREAVTSVTLEEKMNDLSSILVDPGRRARRVLETEDVDCCGRGDCTNLAGGAGGSGDCECRTAEEESASDPRFDFIEHCSEDSAGDLRFYDFSKIDMAEKNLAAGDQIAWGWAGKVTPTGTAAEDGGGGETSTDGKLKRTSVGLVRQEDFDGDLTEWIEREGGSWRIVDGRLYCDAAGLFEWQALTARADMVVQAFYYRGINDLIFRLHGRWQWGGSSSAFRSYLGEARGTAGDHRLAVETAGAASRTALATDPANPVEGSWETVKVRVVGDEQGAWWSDTDVALSAADAQLTGETGRVAISSSHNGLYVSKVFVCQSNKITVNGLPAGYKVIVTGQSLADATVEDGTGTAVHDCGGMFFGFGTVLIYDDTDTLVTSLTPAEGVYGGDTYQFDATSTEESPTQTDESAAGGLAVSLEMSFLGADGSEIGNTEATTHGVSNTEYTRGEATTTIPAGTVTIQPYALRKGDAQGIACIKEPQINRGDEACDFRQPPSPESAPATAPSADQLIVALGLDKRVEPLPLAVEATADNPITEPDGTRHTSGYVKIDDEDGDTLYSRRYRDASGRGNHGFQFNWNNWWTSETWPTPSPSLHGLGLLHPDGDEVDWPNGIISQCRDPYTSTWSAEELADFGSLQGTTWSCWVQPQIWMDSNGVADSVAQNGDLFGRWDTRGGDPAGGGFYFTINISSDGRPFMRVVYEDGTTDDNSQDPNIVWQCDWSFGMLDGMSGVSEYKLLPSPVFFCLRISEPDDVTGTIDWDLWTGRQGLPCAAKVRDEAVVTDIFTSASVLSSGHNAPAMTEPRNIRQFCWMSRFHLDVDKGDALMSSDGCWGLIDKCIGWQRPLEAAEINGLFKGMGDSLFGSFEFLEDAEPRLLMGAPPTVAVDTCAGGTGLTVTPEWEITESVTDAEYELTLRYYDDGVLADTYNNVAPSARSHTHTDATVGSDAATTAEHGWHVEADLIRLDDGAVIETDRTFEIGITYGTC